MQLIKKNIKNELKEKRFIKIKEWFKHDSFKLSNFVNYIILQIY